MNKFSRYVLNAYNMIKVFFIEEKHEKNKELDKISDYYMKIGKNPPKIKIKKDKNSI